MKIALHEITSICAPFEEDMMAYSNAGWKSFELFYDKADAYIKKYDLKKFINLVKTSGLKPIACSGHSILAFASEEEIRSNVEEYVKKIDLLESIECPIIVVGADAPKADLASVVNCSEKELQKRDETYRKHLAHFAEQIQRLADIAKPKGVSISLEMNWCSMVRSVRTMAEIVNLVNYSNVGFVFDFAHFAATPSRLSDLDLLNGKINAVHFNDLRNAPLEIINVNNDRVIPGDGILPINEWIKKIESLNFNGYYSVELFNEDLWAKTAEEIATTVRKKCAKIWPDAQF